MSDSKSKASLFDPFKPDFYREAVYHEFKEPFKVFAIASILAVFLVSFIAFVNVSITTYTGVNAIKEKLPEKFIVRDGELMVEGSNELIEYEEGTQTYFAIDPQGEITQAPVGYINAIVISKNKIIIHDSSRPAGQEDMEITYTEILTSLEKDEIVITEDGISSWLVYFMIFAFFFAIIIFLVGYFIFRPLGLMFYVFVGAIILSLKGVNEPFKKSIATVMYISVPILAFQMVSKVFGTFLFYVIPDSLVFISNFFNETPWFIDMPIYFGLMAFVFMKAFKADTKAKA